MYFSVEKGVPTMDKQLKKLVNKLRLYLFVQSLLKNLFIGFAVGSTISLIIASISILVPWYSASYLEIEVFIVVGLISIIWSIIKYPSKKESALKLDKTGLEERFLTAIELYGDDTFFAALQKKDALKHLEGISFKKSLPLTISWKQCLLSFVLFTCMLLTSFWPSKAKVEAEKRHEVAIEAEELVEKLEKLEPEYTQEDLKQIAEIDKELLKELEQIKKELEDATSKAELEKSTQRAEKKLEQMAQQAKDSSLRDQFFQMSASLNGQSLPANESQLAKLEKMEEELKELEEQLEQGESVGELDSEQLKELAEQMQELASELNNDQLSQSASNFSQMSQNISDLSAQQLAQATQSVQQAISQSQNIQQQANNSASANSGNNNSNNNANGDGQNGSDGSGNNSSGNGNGNGTGNGNNSGNGNGSGWNYGSNVGSEGDISYNGEMVAIPNEVGDDENLTGQPIEGDSYTSQGGPSITWSGTSVDYEQVLKEYSEKAYAQIEGDNYPSGVQGIIKAYFEELNQ